MSGIIGIYHLNGSCVDNTDLKKMMDILAHRGPDDADIWVHKNIGLGHRMLWTTPESLGEKLPLVSKTGNLVLTADARIDNRDRLISQLPNFERPIEKITDSDLILAAYQKWDSSCVDHLIGDFAFAIWDTEQKKLFCARDHFGVKPFYYYYSSEIFAFASEIKALLTLPQVPNRLDEVRIGDFLSLTMEDQVITSYKEIHRLPPAHTITIGKSIKSSQCYWELDPKQEIKLSSDEAYTQEFQRIFTEAVRCRLRSAFPVISHLSGGLDSSAITCVARDLIAKDKHNQQDLHTISTIFDKVTECDERPFINEVLEEGGLIPHYVHGDEFGPLSNLDNIFEYEDEALLGPSHFYPWQLNRAVKDLGLRICLDGFDGDTTVSHGTTRLSELARQGEWETFISEAKAVAKHFNTEPYRVFIAHGLPYLKDLVKKWRWISFFNTVGLIHKHFGISRKLLIIHHGIKPLLPNKIWKLLYRQHTNQKSTDSAKSQISLVNNKFAQKINLQERIENLELPTKADITLREEHWRSLNQGIFVYTLEQMDQYAAMFSLEVRHPFMDKRLIEFCLALPSEQKLYQGWGRMVMRRALRGILPEKIQWRGGKANLTPNFIDGLLNRNRHLLNEVMSDKLINLENYIDVDFLQAAYQRLLDEKEQVSDNDSMAVWQAVILALWLEHKQVKP